MQMILSFILIFYFSISSSFAQQCKNKINDVTAPLIILAQNSLLSTCLLQREQYKCSELESELEGIEKKKII